MSRKTNKKGLKSKKGAHYLKFNKAQNLPNTYVTGECVGLANWEPSTSGATNVKGNTYQMSDYIVPSSLYCVKTCQPIEEKNMVNRPVVKDQVFRSRTLSTRPLPTLGDWMGHLQVQSEKVHPPMTQSMSIMI